MRVDRPILFFLERLDLAFPLDDEAEGNGLYASGRKAASNFIPQQRRNLIADKPVEDTAGLLRVDKILVDGTGMFERCLHGALGDLVEGHTLNAWRSLRLAFLRFLGFLLF